MSVIEDIEKQIQPVVESEKMELVDIQYATESGRKVLRVFLDKEGGIKLRDCEDMSGKISAVIDQSKLMPESFVLEISSPGLDRVLKKEKDFIRYTGRKARITVGKPIDGQRNFSGTILAAGGGTVTIDDVTGKKATLQIDSIVKARLEPEV